ncbi:MAG TPA: class I SAM-dependent rRNA methyltransferase, partial [Anaerolineae bacterium]|nr:class I SAM-dependent rRNA methyltransferase [Anaerolineae bacterium]
IEGDAQDGDLVRVTDSQGTYLATGYLNRRSQIVVRLLTWDAGEPVDRNFWGDRLERAIAGRAQLAEDGTTNAYRLVNAEADGLPGLIVDRYGDWLVVQCLTLGMAGRRDLLIDLLADLSKVPENSLSSLVGIFARDDASVRRKEGLPRETGPLWGKEPPDLVEVLEHGNHFLVDLKRGHKTGFYLDQRENRQRVATCCRDADVLNAFAYTGAFGVYAGLAGARSVVNVESSAEALALAEKNLSLNGCGHQELILGDVFKVVRGYREDERSFDLVILDPPKFATSQAHVMDASRGYKDLNLLAMQLLRRGGLLVTFSCSGLISADLFQKIVFGSSVDAGRDVQILERLAQGPDHPVLLAFPESAYLKGLICRVW